MVRTPPDGLDVGGVDSHSREELARVVRVRQKEAGAEVDSQTVRGVGYFIVGADT